MKKIGIIGAGHMGGAFYLAIRDAFGKGSVLVFDKNSRKLESLKVERAIGEVNQLVEEVDTVVLAVKPQSCGELFGEISAQTKEKLIISIMAGVSLKKLKEFTRSDRIVRSMPNLGVQVGKGFTGWMASNGVSHEDKELIKKIFGSGGASVEVEDEKMINMVGAISGSGPAYYFYLTEMLQKKAERLGFSAADARRMAEMTFIGSADLFEQGNRTAKEWREAVSSKGGSTIEAIQSMQENKFDDILGSAVDVAIKRWEEFDE